MHEEGQAQHSIKKLCGSINYCQSFMTLKLSLNDLSKLSCFIVDCVVHICDFKYKSRGGPSMAIASNIHEYSKCHCLACLETQPKTDYIHNSSFLAHLSDSTLWTPCHGWDHPRQGGERSGLRGTNYSNGPGHSVWGGTVHGVTCLLPFHLLKIILPTQ